MLRLVVRRRGTFRFLIAISYFYMTPILSWDEEILASEQLGQVVQVITRHKRHQHAGGVNHRLGEPVTPHDYHKANDKHSQSDFGLNEETVCQCPRHYWVRFADALTESIKRHTKINHLQNCQKPDCMFDLELHTFI